MPDQQRWKNVPVVMVTPGERDHLQFHSHAKMGRGASPPGVAMSDYPQVAMASDVKGAYSNEYKISAMVLGLECESRDCKPRSQASRSCASQCRNCTDGPAALLYMESPEMAERKTCLDVFFSLLLWTREKITKGPSIAPS